MKPITAAILLSLGLTLHSSADEAAKAKLMAAGKEAYVTCMACHGPDGNGVAAGPNKMAPALAGSALVNGDPSVFALLLLKGIAKENATYLGVMAPMEAMLPDDEKLAAVMTYVRNSFGNTAAVVTPEDAKKYREQWKDLKAPSTRTKLMELEAAAKK